MVNTSNQQADHSTRLVLQPLVTLGDEESERVSASLIHDAVLGKTEMSLLDCISLQPHHIDTPDDLGLAPLHLAVLTDNIEAVRILAEVGVDLTQPTRFRGETALHIACYYNREVIAMCLLDLIPCVSSWDGKECTPLHLCRAAPNITRRLLSLGASLTARGPYGRTPLRGMVMDDIENDRDCCRDKVETLRAYAEAGADLDEVHDGWLLLLDAAWITPYLVQPLLELGANVCARTTPNRQSLLHILAIRSWGLRHIRGLPVPLLRGLDPDCLNMSNSTPWQRMEFHTLLNVVTGLYRCTLGISRRIVLEV